MFELTLAPASEVVKGSDQSKLKYKLTKIQLGYEMIRSKTLATEERSVYSAGKEFLNDHVIRSKVLTFSKGTDTSIDIKVNPQRRSLKASFSSLLSRIQ